MDLPSRGQQRSCKQNYKRLMKFRWSLRLSFFIWTLHLKFAGSLKRYSLRRNPKISNRSWSISTHTKRKSLAYVLLYLRSCSKRAEQQATQCCALIAMWQLLFMTGFCRASPSIEDKHIDQSSSPWLLNIAPPLPERSASDFWHNCILIAVE